MSPRVSAALLFGGCFAASFAIARLAAPDGETHEGARRVVTVRRPDIDLRCTDVSVPAPRDPACAETQAALTTCEAALGTRTAARPSTRLPPPEIPADQEAGPWTDALSDGLAACGIPASLEVTDCDEYPCAAALRVAPTEAATIPEAWKTCPALEHLDLRATDVSCPDGTVETAWVAVSSRSEDWKRAVSGAPSPPGGDTSVIEMIAFGRRVESVLQLWGCNVHP